MKRKLLEKKAPVIPETLSNETTITAQILEVVDREILEIDLFKQSKLICRHFIDKKSKEIETLFVNSFEIMNETQGEVKNYEYKKGQWSTIQFANILRESTNQWWWDMEQAKAADDCYTQMIAKYLETSTNMTIARMIEREESNIRADRLKGQYERKTERIAEKMKDVKPLQDNFYDWIENKILSDRFIFVTKTQKRCKCFCASCKKTFTTSKKISNKITCKHCGIEAITKTRTRRVLESKNIITAQKYRETYVLRHFKVEKMSSTQGTEFNYKEKVRMFMENGKAKEIFYAVEESPFAKYTYETGWSKKRHGMQIAKKFFAFPEGWEETDLNQALIKYIKENGSRELNYNYLIRYWDTIPWIEYVLKAGLFKLADEMTSRAAYGWYGEYNIKATKLHNFLGISKQQLEIMKKNDGASRMLKLLKSAQKISEENLKFFEQNNFALSDLQTKRTELSIEKAMNYMRKIITKEKISIKKFCDLYRDYLNMAEDRGMDLTDDIVRKNKRMIEFHNRYVEEKNAKEEEERIKEAEKKFPAIRNDYKKNAKMFGWEGQGYIIMVPNSATDIIREGKLQHHCVGASDYYMKNMNERKRFIVFLRKEGQQEQPYYTLEIEMDGTVVQAYAAYDRKPDWKTVKKVLNNWNKDIKKRKAVQEVSNGRDSNKELCRIQEGTR